MYLRDDFTASILTSATHPLCGGSSNVASRRAKTADRLNAKTSATSNVVALETEKQKLRFSLTVSDAFRSSIIRLLMLSRRTRRNLSLPIVISIPVPISVTVVRVLSRRSLRTRRPCRRRRRASANQAHQQERTNNQRCLHHDFSHAMSLGAERRPRRRIHMAGIIPTRPVPRCPNPHTRHPVSLLTSLLGLFALRERPHSCGKRSASALRESFLILIMRFSAGRKGTM
jgi:hypothetical protein